MTHSIHAHVPKSRLEIVGGDIETAKCGVCNLEITRFWIHDDYDRLPFYTEWELSK